MTNKTTGSLFIFLLVVGFHLSIQAQPTSWRKGGTQDTRSMGGNDYINLFNGKLNFTLPLLRANGRGNTGFTIPLSIENTAWRYHIHKEPHYVDYPGSGPVYECHTQVTYTSATINGETSGGIDAPGTETCTQTAGISSSIRIMLDPSQFHFVFVLSKGSIDPGYGPGVLYGSYDRRSYYDPSASNNVNPASLNITDAGAGRTTLTLRLPDGSTQMFIDTKSMGRYQSYSIVNGQITYYSREKNFTTIDGSSMSFISDTTISDGNGGYPPSGASADAPDFLPSGYILNKDGTKYRVEIGLIKWTQDVNGNRTTYSYTTPSDQSLPSRISQITDSLGRIIAFSYDVNDGTTSPDGTPYGLRDEISYNGLGGSMKKSIITKTDLGSVLRSDFTLKKYGELWTIPASGNYNTTFTKQVISAVWMSDGTAYKFKYDNYGNLARVLYPSGGAGEYDYDSGFGSNYSAILLRRRVTKKRLYAEAGDQNSLINETTFSDIYSGNTNPVTTIPVQVDTKDPAGNLVSRQKHYFIGDPQNIAQTNDFARTHGFEIDMSGKEIKTEIINPVTQDVYDRTEYNWQFRVPGSRPTLTTGGWDQRLSEEIPSLDPFIAETKTTLEPSNGGGLVTKTASLNPSGGGIGVDINNNQTDIWEYDFGVGNVPALPARHKHINYLTSNPANGINYSGPSTGQNYVPSDLHIRGLSTGGKVYSINAATGAETLLSQSEVRYDETSYPILTGASPPLWIDPQNSTRGNPTTAGTWFQEENRWIESHSQFDQFGNLRKVWDASGDATRFVETQYSSTYQFAYPTSVTTAVPDPSGVNGSNTAFTASTAYDFTTGLPTSVTDANGQTSTMEYNDPLLRPTKTTAPNGQQTITEYGAGTTASTRWVKVSSQIDATNWKQGYSWFDGLGRPIKSQSVDNAGDVFALTCYDNMGRVQKASNPFRNISNPTCSSSLEWTTNTFDAAGRPWKVTTPDGAFVETTYGLSTSGSQIGTAVTVTDQALKQRRSVTNALGQLIRVDEPTDAAGLGAVNTPNQPTNYSYDTLNNLTTVTQGAQTRSFTYNSLSRLLSATNPESGLIQYAYDNNGNLTTKTDARGVQTAYVYDALNRVTQRNYAAPGGLPNYQATPNVSYFYDNLPNAKGKLIKVTNGTGSNTSTTEYTSFDILGRVTAHKQTTDGGDVAGYTTGYTYNLGSALIEETYPSGRKVKNVLDADGDLSLVQSRKNANSGYFNYAKNFTYASSGAVTSLQLGNGKWESTQFNSRLQPTQIALGQTQNATNLLKLDYAYGTTQNNGNVLTQNITVERTGQSPLIFNQTYAYDELNRLKTAEEKTGTTTNWKQTYTFDRYGNRNFDQSQTTFPSFSNPNVTNPTISTANNRLTSSGYTFDAAGNTTADPQGRTFAYDAENKQTAVNNGSTGQYWYDGDGKRVKKYVPASGETTIFVYDAGGKLVAEYSTNPSSPQQVQYLTNDHLGSPRIMTDMDGKPVARTDYMPYGEEIIALGGRASTEKYVADTVRQGFTGYINDSETGLDFAQARYFGSGFGRFSTPDPLQASARSSQPQTWNRYTYALNNPLRFVDPSGMDVNILDEKAKDLLLKTLPKDIRDKVLAAIDKGKGSLTKGTLDKIKSGDENFAALKGLVNNKAITEVATASMGQMGVAFFKISRGDQREKDIQNYVKNNPNVSRKDAEALITADGDQSEMMGYYGQTFSPNGEQDTPKSPSGNLRAVVTDRTGDGSTITEEDAVMAMGHEMYNHTYKFRMGDKTWLNETTPEVKGIEERTIRNYRGEQNKNSPSNIKPRQ